MEASPFFIGLRLTGGQHERAVSRQTRGGCGVKQVAGDRIAAGKGKGQGECDQLPTVASEVDFSPSRRRAEMPRNSPKIFYPSALGLSSSYANDEPLIGSRCSGAAIHSSR